MVDNFDFNGIGVHFVDMIERSIDDRMIRSRMRSGKMGIIHDCGNLDKYFTNGKSFTCRDL